MNYDHPYRSKTFKIPSKDKKTRLLMYFYSFHIPIGDIDENPEDSLLLFLDSILDIV